MAGAVRPKTVTIYQDENGHEPFSHWVEGLRDRKARRVILRRIGKLEHGLYGDCQPVGEGVLELRIFFGPGCRVYFGEDAGNIIVLLCGGGKGSQDKDIKKARKYWKEHQKDG